MYEKIGEIISIIIPVYNCEKYLGRCLDSVISQTYQELDIIVVNDGSTDGSLEICNRYAKRDKRIRVISQKNGGMSKARNKGIKAAHGKYIGFVDSDDWIERDMYEYLRKIINKFQADVAVCDFIKTRKEKKIKQPNEKIEVKRKEQLTEVFYRIYGGKSFFAVWNRLYKREAVKNIFYLEGEINEDIYYTYNIYKKVDTIVFSNLIKYNYFINSNGITLSKLSKKDYSQFRIWDKIVENERGTKNYPYALLNRKRAVFNLYMKGRISGYDESIKKEDFLEWKKQLKEYYPDLTKGGMLDYKRKIALFMICKLNIL